MPVLPRRPFGRAAALVAAVAVATGPLAPSAVPVAAGAERPAAAIRDDLRDDARDALADLAVLLEDRTPAPYRSRTSRPGDGREVTLQLLALRRGAAHLSPTERRQAQTLLARPTDGAADPYGWGYRRDARPVNDCRVRPTAGSKVCVHWARKTSDAPPLKDSDGDGLPDQVERTRIVLNHVWKRVVTEGGYRRPPKDDRGPDGRLDVYLADVGADGIYGYCAAEEPVRGRSYSGFCVVDDDFTSSQFPSRTPVQNLKVTAAHEFFHAVQFGYDAGEDPWFMEGSAVWIEDEIYDAINDNRQYLPYSQLAGPEGPLDAYDGPLLYGSWIWWRFLTEAYPARGTSGLPLIMRELWQRADASGTSYAFPTGRYSVRALREALNARSTNLPTAYTDFVGANRDPRTTYSEGAAYPTAPASEPAFVAGVATGTRRLDHLSSRTVVLTPEPPHTSLTLTFDVPDADRSPRVRVTVVTPGGREETDVDLDTTGAAEVTLPFTPAAVDRVEISLVNAGSDYVCKQGSSWSCSGRPQDDGLDFSWRAEAS